MKHSKLFLTGMAALLLSFGLMMTGCDSGGDSDSDSDTSIKAVSKAIKVKDGATALAVPTTGGGLKEGLKVYIKTDDGAAVKIDDAAEATPDGFTLVNGAQVEQIGPVVVVTGLTAAATTGDGGKLKSGGATPTTETVTVTLEAAAQSAQVSSIAPEAGVPYTLALGDATYTFGANAGSTVIIFDPTDLSTANFGNAPAALNQYLDLPLIDFLTTLKPILNTSTPGDFTIGTGAITNIDVKDDATLTRTLRVPAGAALDIATSKTLTVSTGAIDLGLGATATATGTIVVGGGANTVTIDLATVTATAAEPKFADGATGTVTLSDTNDIVLANTGTIVVAGTGKVELANTTVGAGTYTADGAVTITSAAAGDTIVTTSTATEGLVITGGVSFLGQGSSAATYTLTKGSADGNKVVIKGATITIPADDTSGAGIAGDAKASIVLGSGSIVLGGDTTAAKAGFIDLSTGAKIGVFTNVTEGTTNTEVTAFGGGVIDGTKKDGANGTGTITVGSNGLKVSGATSDITISATIAITTDS